MINNIQNIFNQIQSVYENNTNLTKKYNSAHTVFWFENQAVSYLKLDKTKVTIGFHKGYLLEEKFDFEPTCSKYIRHMVFSDFNSDDKKLINSVIQESIFCAIELEENKILRKHLKGK